ncbi:MAG: hypothetical protein PHP59_10770 [Methanofollis sp.]|uniref:hypothetical protein n=1 Tax=Methanofollis sp. TaxID=2052835 RepID=UPI00262650D6|nr:hypothetical protein [Methanofollis sp.]MDD4255841.1 hypothetical protein [Methanofollis sp.]
MSEQIRRAFFIGITILCACIIVASGVMPFLRPAAIYPSITPASETDETGDSEFVFSFEDSTYRLCMPVDMAVYSGARGGSKNAILYENLSDDIWMTEYYRAFIDDSHQETLYGKLLHAFSDLRDKKDLDSDRYVELVTAFVQAIPYEHHPNGTPPKFPVETIAEGTGDCDDKSLLLAALLSRAGYDVALLDFVNDSHMAVGIAGDHTTFGSTDYIYIETTEIGFVGSVPEVLANGARLSEEPLVIGIGNGTASYTSGDETAYIKMREREAEEITAALGMALDREMTALRAEELRLIEEKDQLEEMLREGDTARYNAGIIAFNKDAAAYNTALQAHDREKKRLDEALEASAYILGHRSDRAATYRWLRDRPLAQTTMQTGEGPEAGIS